MTLPLAVVALVLAIRFVPAHVNETVDPVDNLAASSPRVLVAGLVLAINFAPVPDKADARARAGGDRGSRPASRS